MSDGQVIFAIIAPVCLGAAIFAVTRRDARSSAVGLVVVLASTGALFVGVGATLMALVQILLYAFCATIPVFAALHRLPQLRREPAGSGRPALMLTGALVGIALCTVLGVAILRTQIPAAVGDGAGRPGAQETAVLELFGRLAPASAALFMVVVSALVTAEAARRISSVADAD